MDANVGDHFRAAPSLLEERETQRRTAPATVPGDYMGPKDPSYRGRHLLGPDFPGTHRPSSPHGTYLRWHLGQ